MKLLLDAVFNHVSEKNDKFQDVAKNGSNSLYHDWFVIKGDFPRKLPRNYEVFAECDYMPKWNTSNPAVQEYLISVALYYIKKFHIDGWRLDEAVANRKNLRQPLVLNELLNVKLATMRSKPEGGFFHSLFA